MKTRFFIVLAAMGLLASCAKEKEVTPVVPQGPTMIQVGIDPATKTHMGELVGGERKIYWSNGDKIAINGTASEELSGLDDATQTASFSFAEAPTAPYKVLYPASAYVDANSISLPDFQSWANGSFADDMVPMAGYSSDGNNITVGYLCAVLKVSVKRAASTPDEDKLLGVRFRGRNGEQVKGKFTIDYTSGTLTGASSADGDKEVRVYQTLPTETAAVYFVTVPAGTYASGFELVVEDENHHYMTRTKSGSVTLQAGTIYNVAEFEFVPTATELGVEIASAEDLVAFATAYNNKEYASQGEHLLATLTADIAFDATTSAAFNATGGIGLKMTYDDAEDYYFTGEFNGGGYTISGLAATTPLFKATRDAYVHEFNIDNSCSFTFTHNDTADKYYGSVVGYLRGELSHVNVAADITLAGADITHLSALGGLVGRVVEANVKDCIYSGNITVPDSFSVNAKRTYVGGLVGYISNPDGKVTDSDFEGTIDFAGTVASTDKTNPYLMIGGIIGSNPGTVSGCEVKATKTKAITMDNDKSYTATIQNHTRKAYHVAQGGIAGLNSGTVSGCINGASIMNFILSNATKDGTAADANSRYYDLGGIVGLNLADGEVSGCVNNGLMESRCTPRIQKIGGIVGYNLGAVSSCVNNTTGSTGDIYLTTTNISPYSVRVGEVGGIIGNNAGTVSDVENFANIRMDRSENAAGVEIKFGGVMGLTSADIDGGALKSIINHGNISDEYNGTTVTTDGIRLGGIVGSAQASVKNVHNQGNVTMKLSATNVMSKLYMGGIAGEVRGPSDPVDAVISGCDNEGEVYFNVNAKNAAHTDNYAGGIFGKSFNANVTVSECTNSGYIHGGNGSKQNGKTMYLGGIVAYLDGASSISDCENTGTLLNDQFNNNVSKDGSTFEGGIAGFVLGTETERITISDVSNNVNSGAAITGARRGYTGGAVGYGEYVDISNATNANSYGGGSGYYYGGIAGWLVNGTISGSTMSGTSISSSQMQKGGGIVAVLDTNSTVDGCTSHVTSFSHTDTTAGASLVAGAIAGTSVAGTTISNCHYPSSGTITNSSSGASPSEWSMTICSDSNFTDGGGNAADL